MLDLPIENKSMDFLSPLVKTKQNQPETSPFQLAAEKPSHQFLHLVSFPVSPLCWQLSWVTAEVLFKRWMLLLQFSVFKRVSTEDHSTI